MKNLIILLFLMFTVLSCYNTESIYPIYTSNGAQCDQCVIDFLGSDDNVVRTDSVDNVTTKRCLEYGRAVTPKITDAVTFKMKRCE